MSFDPATDDPQDVERELWRVVCLLGATLEADGATSGYRWGGCLSLAILEYLRSRGHVVQSDGDGVCEVGGEAFRAARLAIRAAILEAERDGRLPRPRRGGRNRRLADDIGFKCD